MTESICRTRYITYVNGCIPLWVTSKVTFGFSAHRPFNESTTKVEGVFKKCFSEPCMIVVVNEGMMEIGCKLEKGEQS